MKHATIEKQASVKNGISRMAVACLSILVQLLLILGLFTKLYEYAVWVQTVTQILAIILVLKIYGQHKTSSMKMPWIILTVIFPVAGIVLYFLIGSDGYSGVMRKRYQDIDAVLLPMLPANEKEREALAKVDVDAYAVASYIQRNAQYPVYRNTKVTYFEDAAKGLDVQIREMRRAEKFIFMEYHAIEDAESWHRIQEVLEERVKAGVEVRVFYDDMGSVGFIDTDFAVKLRGLGIACRVFNPFMPVVNVFLNNRDHRKITVIDGKVGFTGGYNLANEYFNVTHPYGEWKDTGIMLEGDAVRSLTVTFLEMWNAVKRQGPADASYEPYLPKLTQDTASADVSMRPGDGRTPGKLILETGESGESGEKTDLPSAEKGRWGESSGTGRQHDGPQGFVQPYADSPMDEEQVGENVYIDMIGRANRTCWFMTPYLIITDEMTHALTLAAKRGVDVRIITPGIPDKKMVYSVTRSFYNSLVRDGVRVYEWTPGFDHAKMCIVDGKMAACGTINLDYRSLYHHFENGCFFCGCEAVADMKADFERTFEQCRDVTDQYRYGRSASLRLWQLFLRLFAQLM